MKKEFIEFSTTNGILPAKETILAAVSGGIDSMVMLSLYLEAGIKPAVAHCNFSLRGTESDGDEELVRKFSMQNGLAFHSVKFNTREYAAANRLSIQMAARELRYNWFEEIRQKNGYAAVAVAHNLNDNAETFFINLLRGTGINGLTGMKPRNGYIIRPLLFASRDEIAGYAERNNVAYREDSSNAQVKYTRNKIRHKIFPILREINPDVLTSISLTMNNLAGTAAIAEDAVTSLYQRMFVRKGDEIHILVNDLLQIKDEKTLVFELFRRHNLTPAQCDELTELLSSSTGKVLLTDDLRIIRDRDKLILAPAKKDNVASYIFNNKEEIFGSGLFNGSASADVAGIKIDADPRHAFLDSALVTFPLVYRKWEAGDRFSPLGLKGMKKVSDFLVDSKISLSEKEKVMVLVSGDDIIWVAGYRIDNRYRITEKTGKVFMISLTD